MARRREPKFFQTEEFKNLQEIWVTGKRSKVIQKGKISIKVIPSRLSQAGFEDIETSTGSLKFKNKRTQGFEQQETVSLISSALCSYIDDPRVKLRPTEKKILELYSRGIYTKQIIQLTGRSHQTVWKTVRRHKPVALGLYAED